MIQAMTAMGERQLAMGYGWNLFCMEGTDGVTRWAFVARGMGAGQSFTVRCAAKIDVWGRYCALMHWPELN